MSKQFHETHWSCKATTVSSVLAVGIEDAKAQCNYLDSDRDDWFAREIRAAAMLLEEQTLRSFITKTYTMKLDGFPCDGIQLRRCPAVSVASITYYDTAGVLQTLSTDIYTVDVNGEPGRIGRKFGQVWPVALWQIASVIVTFDGGYGATSATVPDLARNAILLMVAHKWMNREAVQAQPSNTVELGWNYAVDSLRWSDGAVG